MEEGGRPERARGDDNGEELRQIRGGKVVDGLECVEKGFKSNSEFDREPVKLLEDGGDMQNFGPVEAYEGICEGHRKGVSYNNRCGR